MNRLMFAALAMTAFVAAAPRHRPAAGADRAGNRMLAFAAPARRGSSDPFALHCTADRAAERRWCARLVRGGAGGAWRLELALGAGPARRFELAAPEDALTELSIWPHIVIEPGGAAIVGVERVRSESFTDREGDDGRLILLRAGPAPAPLRQVLEVPTWSYSDLYMCLHPGDSRRRFGACWERKEYVGRLTLDPATRAGPPHFLFTARARTYPAHNVLEREMDRQVPLRRSDLRWATDPECSYRRRIAWQARQGTYQADGPFPRCPDYFGF
jgi:hypothetical protein